MALVVIASSVVFILIDRAEKRFIPITVSATIDFIKNDSAFMDNIGGEIKEYTFNHAAPEPSSKMDTVIISISGSRKKIYLKSYLKKNGNRWKVNRVEYEPVIEN